MDWTAAPEVTPEHLALLDQVIRDIARRRLRRTMPKILPRAFTSGCSNVITTSSLDLRGEAP